MTHSTTYLVIRGAVRLAVMCLAVTLCTFGVLAAVFAAAAVVAGVWP